MKKLVFLLVAALLIAGCTQGPSKQPANLNYMSGSQGLVMELANGMPPAYIYNGDRLSIGLTLTNAGTSQLTDGYLYIAGYDPSIIDPNGNTATGSLPLPQPGTYWHFTIPQHRTQYDNVGGQVFQQFQSNYITLPPNTPSYLVPLTIYACYVYETHATATVCFDPYPHNTEMDKPCITQDVGLGSQGAPIAVTNVAVSNNGGQTVRMIFTIQNVGGGVVFNLNDMQDCPSNIGPDVRDTVTLSSVSLVGNGAGQISCSYPTGNSGNIRLGPGETGTIVCEAPIARAAAAYQRTVQIDLTYGYAQYIKQTVEIRST